MIDWKTRLKDMGAIWEYSVGGPHVKTILSGQHTNFYFNTDIVRDHPEILQEMVADLLNTAGISQDEKPDFILTFKPFGVPPALTAGKILGVPVTIADPANNFKFDKLPKKNSKLLTITDEIYTGGSMLNTIAVAEASGYSVGPVILAYLNNSGFEKLDGRRIKALMTRPSPLFPEDNCPMCKAGSKALNPRDNWSLLS